MIKKMFILLALLLLVGCSSDTDALTKDNANIKNELDNLKESVEELKLSKNQMIEDNTIMKSDLDSLNKSLIKKDQQIEDLKLELRMIRNDMIGSLNNESYETFKINYLSDALNASDDYIVKEVLITNFDEASLTLETVYIEFVAYYDDERIDELKIDRDDPIIAGSYIYKDENITASYSLDQDVKLIIFDWDDTGEFIEKDLKTLGDYTDRMFRLSIIDGKVFRVTDIFLN